MGGIIVLGGLFALFQLWENVVLNGSMPDLMKTRGFVVQAMLLTAGGLHLLALVATEIWRRRDIVTLTLVLWIGGIIYFATVLNWTINVRSFLPLVPATAILLVRRLDRIGGKWTEGFWPVMPLIPAVAIALGVAVADYQLANSARTAATEITAKYKSANHTLWFEGHAAFQYYMEKLGGRPLDMARSNFQPGDVVVIPEVGIIVWLPQGVVGWVDHRQYMPSVRMNVIGGDRDGLAGFYSANTGPLPFTFGKPAYQSYDFVKVFFAGA